MEIVVVEERVFFRILGIDVLSSELEFDDFLIICEWDSE